MMGYCIFEKIRVMRAGFCTPFVLRGGPGPPQLFSGGGAFLLQGGPSLGQISIHDYFTAFFENWYFPMSEEAPPKFFLGGPKGGVQNHG